MQSKSLNFNLVYFSIVTAEAFAMGSEERVSHRRQRHEYQWLGTALIIKSVVAIQ